MEVETVVRIGLRRIDGKICPVMRQEEHEEHIGRMMNILRREDMFNGLPIEKDLIPYRLKFNTEVEENYSLSRVDFDSPSGDEIIEENQSPDEL